MEYFYRLGINVEQCHVTEGNEKINISLDWLHGWTEYQCSVMQIKTMKQTKNITFMDDFVEEGMNVR